MLKKYVDINDYAAKYGLKDVFDRVLKLPDQIDHKNIGEIIQFLNLILRYKNVRFITPVTEFVTVLKYEKPILFSAAKRAVPQTSNLYMLFRIDSDLELSLKNIDEFFKAIGN